jgi:NAD(P)-dependent dehydrogenase (short-subunit alcohol dehydrogenase family)
VHLRIACVVNNAGGSSQPRRPIEEISREAWDRTYASNLTCAFNFMRAVTPNMKLARIVPRGVV